MLTKRAWDIVHRREEKEKSFFLKRLTHQEGFEIFQDLYQMAYRIKSKDVLFALDSEKIKTLSKIHSLLNKLKI